MRDDVVEVEPWSPLGRGLADFHAGRERTWIRVESDLWTSEWMAVRDYYRPLADPVPEVEAEAVARCRGRVLDLGAGAGRHALELQRRGHEVVAVDICPEAVAVMEARGVADARRGDLFSVAPGRFDTVLMMMNGLGAVGDMGGLARFLRHLHNLLAPGGALIADCADIRDIARPGWNGDDRHPGEVRFRLTYDDLRGRSYPWFFVDPETLAEMARAEGFAATVVATARRGSYLARLDG